MGGQCQILSLHRHHQGRGWAVLWHHPHVELHQGWLKKPKGQAADDAHKSLSLSPCHWLFSSVGHQPLGQKFRW